MPIINRCFCWDDLRSAAQATAMYSLFSALAMIMTFIYFLSNSGNMYEEGGALFELVYKIWFSFVFLYAIGFIVSVILLIGVQNDQKGLLLPYVVYTIVYLLSDGGLSIYMFVLFGVEGINTFFLILYIYRALVSFCCELCIISQYQLLSSGKGMKTLQKDQKSTGETFTVSIEEPEVETHDTAKLTDTPPSQVREHGMENPQCEQSSQRGLNTPFDDLFRSRTSYVERGRLDRKPIIKTHLDVKNNNLEDRNRLKTQGRSEALHEPMEVKVTMHRVSFDA